MNYTYMLKCKDGTLYTGWTTDLKKRVHAHNEGKGAKYTKSRTPVTLVYYEVFETKQEALRRESAIKKMPRSDKLKLIRENKLDQILVHADKVAQAATHDKEMKNLMSAEAGRQLMKDRQVQSI